MKLLSKFGFSLYVFLFLLMTSCHPQQKIVKKRFDVKRDWPVVLLTLNGKPAYFLLDTGANETLLDASDSKAYSFVQLPYGRMGVGIGGYSISSYVDGANITVEKGGLLKGDYTAQDLSRVFSGYETLTGRNLVGIIGNDILKGHNVIIDYSNMTVTFSNFTLTK